MGNLVGSGNKKGTSAPVPWPPPNDQPVAEPSAPEPVVVAPVLTVAEKSTQELQALSEKVKEHMEIVDTVKSQIPVPDDMKEKTKYSIAKTEEDIMQLLLKCDNVECDETTRILRKNLVNSIHNDLAKLDDLKTLV